MIRPSMPAALAAAVRRRAMDWARGTIAREAIDAGLRAVAERLRRTARRDAREAGK